MEDVSPQHKRAQLRAAIHDLRERGLAPAARWAAEQLAGLPAADPEEHDARRDAAAAAQPADDDSYLLARSLFEMKEYRRAAHVLADAQGGKSLFLRCYAMYLAGEKRKQEERVEASGALGKAQVVNKELDALETQLEALQRGGSADAFCSYLYGLLLIDRERKVEARSVLLASVWAYPCNWSAWKALAVVCSGAEGLRELEMPAHWMRDFFLADLCLEMQHNSEGLSRLQALSDEFPRSDWVVCQAATAHYNLRNFDEAQDLFEDLLDRDPHRIEGMDIYSNILYVKEAYASLSHLAHRASITDKYRPETACIIGNYYSLKGQHEKAVMYFRRALALDRSCLSAWTLMGHEYVEMKNPPAAIEAYRRAVDLNPRDYRAWYGLGQTYELLHMPYYALFYFRCATKLRPLDARMWCAMGQCYENEQLGMDAAAIRCYRRALVNQDREGIALHKLALLHERRGERGEAAHYFRMNLQRIEEQGSAGQDAVEALQFLGQYSMEEGRLAEAEQLALRLLEFGAAAKEKAKSLLRHIRAAQGDEDSGVAGYSAASTSGGDRQAAAVTPVPHFRSLPAGESDDMQNPLLRAFAQLERHPTLP